MDRCSIHAASPKAYRESSTRDPVAGGTSVQRAIGSALSRQWPSRPSRAYLYTAPAPTPGTKISQIPESPMDRIACWRPSQPLKSPLTRTAVALGAQTAKEVPETSPPGEE